MTVRLRIFCPWLVLLLALTSCVLANECIKFKNVKIAKTVKEYYGSTPTWSMKPVDGSGMKYHLNFTLDAVKEFSPDTMLAATATLPGVLLPFKFSLKMSEAKTKDDKVMPEVIRCTNKGINRSPNLPKGKVAGKNCVIDFEKLKSIMPREATGTGQVLEAGTKKVLLECTGSYKIGKC